MVGVEKVVIISVERSDFVRSQKGYVYYQPSKNEGFIAIF